jgi:hypothetical protein
MSTQLDPETPGPIDLLTHEQRKVYKDAYYSYALPDIGTDRHRAAWRAAVTATTARKENPC